MKTTTKNTGIKVTTNVKAAAAATGQSQRGRPEGQGGRQVRRANLANHNRSGLKVKAGLKAGRRSPSNHNTGLNSRSRKRTTV